MHNYPQVGSSHSKYLHRIGHRDRRIAIERDTVTRTDTGAERRSWQVIAEMYAAVGLASQNSTSAMAETEEMRQVVSQHKLDFVIAWRHYLDDLNFNERDRIVYRGKVYDILGIDEHNGREQLLIIKTHLNKT